MNPQDTQVLSSTPVSSSSVTAPVVQTPAVSPVVETPEIALDLSDIDFGTPVVEPVQEVVPEIVENNVPEIAQEVISEPIQESIPESIPEQSNIIIQGTQEVEGAPVELLTPEEVQETVQEVVQEVVPEIISDAVSEATPEVSQEVQQQETPVVEQAPAQDWLAQEDALAGHSLEKDAQILQEIHGSAGENPVDVVSVEQSASVSASPSEPVQEAVPFVEKVAPSSSVVDLDSLLGTNTSPSEPLSAVTNAYVQEPVQTATPSPEFIFPSVVQVQAATVMPQYMQNQTVAQTANQIPVQIPLQSGVSEHPSFMEEHHLSKFHVLFVAVIVLLGGFVLKVMYPLEYHSMLAFVGIEQKENITGSSQDVPSLEDTLAQTGDVMSGADFAATGFNEADLLAASTGSTDDEPALAFDTGSFHGSAPESTSGFDAFKELDEGIATGANTQATKDTLEFYVNEGKKFLVLAKKSQDKDMMKYSLVLYKKAGALLDSLANGDQIASTGVDQEMKQFSGYLAQLNSLSHAETGDTSVVSQEEVSSPGSEQAFSTGESVIGSGDR